MEPNYSTIDPTQEIKETAHLICCSMYDSFYSLSLAYCAEPVLRHSGESKIKQWLDRMLPQSTSDFQKFMQIDTYLPLRIQRAMEVVPSIDTKEVPDMSPYCELIKAASCEIALVNDLRRLSTISEYTIDLFKISEVEILNRLVDALHEINHVYYKYHEVFQKFDDKFKRTRLILMGPLATKVKSITHEQVSSSTHTELGSQEMTQMSIAR